MAWKRATITSMISVQSLGADEMDANMKVQTLIVALNGGNFEGNSVDKGHQILFPSTCLEGMRGEKQPGSLGVSTRYP